MAREKSLVTFFGDSQIFRVLALLPALAAAVHVGLSDGREETVFESFRVPRFFTASPVHTLSTQ